MARKNQEQITIRRYLLRQLPDTEQQTVELRFLSDDSFSEQLEIVEDELIDEYVAEELSSEERERFEQTFLAHPERKRKLQAGQALQRHFDRIPVAPPGRFAQFLNWVQQISVPAPIRVPVALLVVAVIGLSLWRGVIYQNDVDKGMTALNAAYSQERPVEVRISELKYAPFGVTRSGEPPLVNTLERNRAQRFFEDAVKESADARSYHALGRLHLLQKEIDKAIEYLELAKTTDPDNAQLYADLGAAYLEKGKQESEASKSNQLGPGSGKSLEDLGRSLEYLKLALERNPNLSEASFNRALVLQQYQGLDQQAEEAWRAYLAKDPNSPWAVEAREKLKRLEEKKANKSQNASDPPETFMRAFRARDDAAAWEIYRRSHGRGGNSITQTLVDRFLVDKVSNKAASENLQALAYLGQLEFREVEDAYTSDLAKIYASATPQTQALLIQARQQVVKGYELLDLSKDRDAIEMFAAAQSTFEKVGDFPESLMAESAMAHGATVQPDLTRGQKLLERIVPASESKGYRWLFAETLTQRAHIESNLNNYSAAIIDGTRALALFQELKDLSSTLTSFVQLATLHLFLHDSETSFSFLRRAMAVAQEEDAAPTKLWGIHIAVSLNLSALQLYRAAFDYQNEALQLVLPSKKPLYISRSYQYIGLTYGSLRRFDLALENLRLAYEQGKPLEAERNGKNMMASASLRLGDLYRVSGDETNALAAYEESSRIYETLDFGHYRYAAHKGKFLSYLAQNNNAMAWQELQIVLGLFEKYREKILWERQKAFFFDREQDTYDLAIDFAYSRLADERRAFDYSETCRARNLRELKSHGAQVSQSDIGLDVRSSRTNESESAPPLTATEIQQKLPERVQLVQYAVLEKKLLVWHITRSKIFTKSIDIDSSRLAEMVATTLRQIRHRNQNTNSLKDLYNLLIEPIRGELDSGKVLCFIPDKVLHYVPFSALISASSGRYLVQDYRLMTSPSATILIESSERALNWPSDKEERLLAIGNPTFDRAANPNLSNLPDAEREVEVIASSYPFRHVLVGRQATRKSVTAELARANVAHFAAHYQIDPSSRLESKLLLSPEAGDQAHPQSSGLESADIYRMHLAQTKLVILAACQTGIEQQLRGEGPIGFARSFLVAGVPVVVASLWPVDSEATSELMVAFHRFRRREHLSTTESLMRAQQEILTRENYRDPYYWAGFTAIGGYSDF